jgi:hypothetical protein
MPVTLKRNCSIVPTLPGTGGGLAQLGEHDVRNVGVGGSNPLPSTKPRLRVSGISIKYAGVFSAASGFGLTCLAFRSDPYPINRVEPAIL